MGRVYPENRFKNVKALRSERVNVTAYFNKMQALQPDRHKEKQTDELMKCNRFIFSKVF